MAMLLKFLNSAGPETGKGTYISNGATVIGEVKIGERVFVAPTAAIRADEENSSISIDDECNVQDGVIIHALKDSEVKVGRGTSLSHGCIVHGPCSIGRDCLIGFRATVFRAEVGQGSVVMHGATVMNVSIPPGRLVPAGIVLDSQDIAEALGEVPADLKEFKSSVKDINLEMLNKYSERRHDTKNVEDIARLDLGRHKRTGVPETIFAENKDPEDVAKLAIALAEENGYSLATRVKKEDVLEIEKILPENLEMDYNERARTIVLKKNGFEFNYTGKVGLLAAGTADIPVAEEAGVTAEVMGCEVIKAYDVGIAGLHRLFTPLKKIQEAGVSAIIVVAGMEGALPSVVSSLVDVPVIGVPTSVGYGFGSKGQGALMTMLQSCSPGLAVVNIDNGFGAGAYAALIARNKR
jgi:hypothetical protein